MLLSSSATRTAATTRFPSTHKSFSKHRVSSLGHPVARYPLLAHMEAQKQQQHMPDVIPPHQWTKHMSAYYFKERRNWLALEDFYAQLVAGTMRLSDIGLSAARQPAADLISDGRATAQQQHNTTELLQPPQRRDARNNGLTRSRTTYKLHVSYLGGCFSGWLRGNQNSKPAVQDSLAKAIAATGLCIMDTGSNKAKKAAARAQRRALARQASAQAQDTPSPTKTAANAEAPPEAAPTHSDRAISQLPFVLCGGRTDAGVSAVGQVASFYSWQPQVAMEQLVLRINEQLSAQWAAAAAEQDDITPAQAPHINDVVHCSTCTDSQPNNSQAPAGSHHEALAAAQATQAAPGCPLRVWGAEVVQRTFHPTFAATWRRYVYLLPLRRDADPRGPRAPGDDLLPKFTAELHQVCDLTTQQQHQVEAAPDVDLDIANMMLQQLQGRKLNFFAFARDTPPGKDCECTLLLAKASRVYLPLVRGCSESEGNVVEQGGAVQPASLLNQPSQSTGVSNCPQGATQAMDHGWPCLAVELVGDRFLRKMVRVLVGTLVREVVDVQQQVVKQGLVGPEEQQRLLQLVHGMDRSLTAGPAPALGLCFAAVGYDSCDD